MLCRLNYCFKAASTRTCFVFYSLIVGGLSQIKWPKLDFTIIPVQTGMTGHCASLAMYVWLVGNLLMNHGEFVRDRLVFLYHYLYSVYGK